MKKEFKKFIESLLREYSKEDAEDDLMGFVDSVPQGVGVQCSILGIREKPSKLFSIEFENDRNEIYKVYLNFIIKLDSLKPHFELYAIEGKESHLLASSTNNNDVKKIFINFENICSYIEKNKNSKIDELKLYNLSKK